MTSLFGTPRQVANGWVHPDAPPQPVLSLCADDGSLCVTITPIPGATEYSVYLGEAPGAEDTSPIITTAASKFSIPSLANGTTYYAYATALVEGVESMRSLEQSATPFAVVQPSLTTTENTDGTTSVEWVAQSNVSYVLSDNGTPVWGGQGYDGTMRTDVDVPFTSANSFTITASNSCTCTSPPPPPPLSSVNFDSPSFGTLGSTVSPQVDISAAPIGAATVGYATADGSGSICGGVGQPVCGIAGTHYQATSGTLTFPNGDGTPKSFDVTVLDSTIQWIAVVNLSSPSNCTVGSPSTATIEFTPS